MSTHDAVSQDVAELSLHDTTQGAMKPEILNPEDVFYLPSLSSNDLPCDTRPEPYFLPPGEWVVTPRSTSLDPKNDVVWIQKGYEGAFDQTLVFDEGPCPACAGEHPRCDVCYKFHHYERCPYFILIPRGAHFNPRYEVICDCGNLFNEEKWFCTSCFGTTAVLSPKPDCVICGDISHMKHDCPVDKPRAAFYKCLREKQLNGCDEQKQIPWNSTESELDAMRLMLSSYI